MCSLECEKLAIASICTTAHCDAAQVMTSTKLVILNGHFIQTQNLTLWFISNITVDLRLCIWSYTTMLY